MNIPNKGKQPRDNYTLLRHMAGSHDTISITEYEAAQRVHLAVKEPYQQLIERECI